MQALGEWAKEPEERGTRREEAQATWLDPIRHRPTTGR
jgi:hypothetical protein